MSESKELTNRKLGEDVVGLVGGSSNIVSIAHCMTRLRFKLRDESKADTKAIESLKGVVQVLRPMASTRLLLESTLLRMPTMLL